MGQYYYIVNVSKGEYIHPHDLDCGMKLCEMSFLGMYLLGLLSDGNSRGCGDLRENPMWGSWAGDKIVIAGDYADKGTWVAEVAAVLKIEPNLEMNLHEFIGEYGTNISKKLPEDIHDYI